MVNKRLHVETFYHGDTPVAHVPAAERIESDRPYQHLGHLRHFGGRHPVLMEHLIAEQDWSFSPDIERQRPRWLRYVGMVIACPRDSLRIFVSRLILAWNSVVPAPKLR